MVDVYGVAGCLFDGGWTSEDAEMMTQEYELTPEEAEEICLAIKYLEAQNKKS